MATASTLPSATAGYGSFPRTLAKAAISFHRPPRQLNLLSPPRETVRLLFRHFPRVLARRLPVPEFVEGDEVVGQEREAYLGFGSLKGSARDLLEPAIALRVREPALDRAASLTVECLAFRCLHAISHLVNQVFVWLAPHGPGPRTTLDTTILERTLLAVGRVGPVNLQRDIVSVGLLFRRALRIRKRIPLRAAVARNCGVPGKFVLPNAAEPQTKSISSRTSLVASSARGSEASCRISPHPCVDQGAHCRPLDPC
jgi:hypothetical protein